MHGPVHNLAALAVCLCFAASLGCAGSSRGSWFAKKKTPEEALHIKTPDDRLKELRQLAKDVKKKSPDEQQRIVNDLARQIQQEAEPPMRRQILRTLSGYPQPLATTVLVAGLSDGDNETRRVACGSLGARGGPEAVQELTRIISSDTNLDVRLAAVRALGHTHDKAALMPLTEALADADPAVQARAHESLAAVSGRDFGMDAKVWHDYVQTGKVPDEQISFAERMKRLFY